MTQNLAVCPVCGITVACDAGTVVRHHLATPGGKADLCPGSHAELNPQDTYTTRVPSFRERFPALPLWVAIQEDDARKEEDRAD